MNYVLSNVIPEPPDKRNFMLAIPAGVIQNLPRKTNNRQWASPIENQGHLNTCVANGTGSQLEFIKTRAGLFQHLSRKFIYFNATNYWSNLRGKDSGAYPSDGVKSCYQFGVCAETTWAYNEAIGNIEPPPAAYAEAALHKVTKYERVGYWGHEDNFASIELLKATLAMGYTVGFGMFLCDEYRHLAGPLGSPTNRYDKIVTSNAEYIGGHYQVILDYDDDLGGVIVQNSWDDPWGDHGLGFITYRALNQACMDCIVVTAFDGIEYAPDWSMLPSPPLTATITNVPDVQYMANSYDNNIFAQILTVVPDGGTPGYEYTWSTTDSHVLMSKPRSEGVTGTPTANAQPQVTFNSLWPKGEQRSVTVTCTISDYSLPRQTTTVQTLIRLCNAVTPYVTDPAIVRTWYAKIGLIADEPGVLWWAMNPGNAKQFFTDARDQLVAVCNAEIAKL